MSPSDLGDHLKPFVFLDLFEADMREMSRSMPVHPHSGIATVTVFTEGDATFDDPLAGHGTIGYGGVEWARAGKGMWHGKELSAGASPMVRGFQLWIALPPDLELAQSESQYLAGEQIPAVGPAHVILGVYDGMVSPVRAPGGIVYLLVTLKPGERWRYEPPAGHTVLWVAVGGGTLDVGSSVAEGELALFENGEAPVTLEGGSGTGAKFVLGSAIPHPYPLHLGSYSVHTSHEALAVGEGHIRELRRRMQEAGVPRSGSGGTPVFRG